MNAARARRLLPAGVAVAGVVVAHGVDYALAFPDPAARARELSVTGHGYWPVAVAVAVASGLLAAALAVRTGLLGTRSGGKTLSVLRLAAVQIPLFVLVEVVERLGAGADPIPFLRSRQLALGLALQVAVAVAAVVLLRIIEAGTRRIAEVLRLRQRRPRTTAGRRWARGAGVAVPRWHNAATPARGPPLFALP